jgi:ATP-dependent DNA ligase
MPDFVEPMKAKLVASRPAGDWIYEIKFDGYCATAAKRESYRGTKKTWVPEVKDSIAALDVQDAIIDYAACGIMQRILSSATRRESLGKHLNSGRRGGGLKIA